MSVKSFEENYVNVHPMSDAWIFGIEAIAKFTKREQVECKHNELMMREKIRTKLSLLESECIRQIAEAKRELEMEYEVKTSAGILHPHAVTNDE